MMELTLESGEVVTGWRVIPYLPFVAIWLIVGFLTGWVEVKKPK